jgi:Cu/Ag efflux protein CusF
MTPIAIPLLCAALFSGPVFAQAKADDHATQRPVAATTPAAGDGELSEGVVRKIDKDAGKLTLRHGEIKNLEMPGMTMVFRVGEPALLDKVKVGDKVRFRAENSADGFVVTVIEPAP